MTPAEYEEYVSELVRQLDFCGHGRVFRNKRYQGVRQPGEYEIDVSVEVSFDTALNFLLIVECKNWTRPVDRPLVQKLAQTRDAIAAHKAAIASPTGFTREAKDVGQAHGIALWVISKAEWHIVMGLMGPPGEYFEEYRERKRYLETLGFRLAEHVADVELTLVDASVVRERRDIECPWVRFAHERHGGSAVPPGSGEPGVDPATAASQVMEEVGRRLGMDVPHTRLAARSWQERD